MGVLTALQFAPGLLLGLAAGVWLDRARRRPVLIGTQVASAAVLATVPLAAALNVLSIQQLYVVSFLAGAAAVVFGVAQISYLPMLVGRERLIEGNARYQTSRTVASLIGPGLAGTAVQLLTAPMAIVMDAVSFVVGAVTAAWIRVAEPAPQLGQRPTVREAIAGFAFLWRQRLVRGITGTLLLANIGAGMSSAVFVLLFVGQLGVPPVQVGLVFVASSLSSLAGSLLIRPLQDRAGLGLAMTLATAQLAVGVVVRTGAAFVSRPSTLPLLIAGALVGGLGLMIYNVAQQSIQQAVIPDQLLGRTTAAVSLVINAGSVVAALAGGALGQLIGLRETLVVATVLTVLCVLPTALSPLCILRTVPDASSSVTAPEVTGITVR